MTWLIALGDTTHIVSVLLKSSIWCLTVRCTGAISLALRTTYFSGEHLRRHLYLPLMSHAQIRNDMSNKRKAEAAKKQNVRKTLRKMIKTRHKCEGLSNRAAAYLPRSPLAGIPCRIVLLVKWI